jgi:hypothetical protein
MKVLARIPALDAAAITVVGAAEPCDPHLTGPAEGTARSTTMAADRRPRARVRPPRSRFPTTSVAVLAVLAAVAWSLASWSDAHRAERSRLERLARMEPVTSSPGTVSR